MGDRLTRAQAAERFGVSRQRIDELINGGQLKEERATVDSDEADALWATFDPDYVARDRAAKAMRQANDSTKKVAELADLFNRAKTKKEALRVQELELNLAIKKGQYVSKQLVTQQSYAVLKLLSQKLQNISRQLAPQVAILLTPEECEEVISREVDRLIADMRDGLGNLGTAD